MRKLIFFIDPISKLKLIKTFFQFEKVNLKKTAHANSLPFVKVIGKIKQVFLEVLLAVYDLP